VTTRLGGLSLMGECCGALAITPYLVRGGVGHSVSPNEVIVTHVPTGAALGAVRGIPLERMEDVKRVVEALLRMKVAWDTLTISQWENMGGSAKIRIRDRLAEVGVVGGLPT